MTRRYLTPAQAAEYLGVSVRTLQRLRHDENGPPVRFVRTESGAHLPRYRSDDLDAWLDAATRERDEGSSSGAS